jgi:hypothetical protein
MNVLDEPAGSIVRVALIFIFRVVVLGGEAAGSLYALVTSVKMQETTIQAFN